MSNTITAFFKGRIGVAESVYQYDYGLVLVLDGVSFVGSFDAYFQTTGSETAIPAIGNQNRVAIPNACLANPGTVTLHIPIHTGQNDSEVEYTVSFKVIRRAQPVDGTDDVEDLENAISRAIALLQHPNKELEDRIATLNKIKVNHPLNEHGLPLYGNDGQLLRTKGNGLTEWVDVGQPTDEQTAEAVSAWLDAHPESTTTVVDGSLTYKKLVIGTLGYVTPEMFGAKGDGTTDDTDAFAAMLADYSECYLTKTYAISSALQLPSNTHIFGDGTILDKRTDAPDAYEGILQSDGSNICIEGITIVTDGNDTTVLLKCELYFDNASHIRISDVKIDYADGLYGICCDACNDTIIENCIVDGYNYCAIGNINGGNNFIVDKCRILDCKATEGNAYGIMLNGYDDVLTEDTNGGQNLQAINNYFYSESPFWECIDAHGGTDILIDNNVFDNCINGISAFSSPNRHFYIVNSVITNNIIKCNGNDCGIVASGEGLIVSNNIIKNAGNSGTSIGALHLIYIKNAQICNNAIYDSLDWGIDIVQAENALIESNIVNTVTPSEYPYGVALYISNASYSNLIIKNNLFSDAEYGVRYPSVINNESPYIRSYDNIFDTTSDREYHEYGGVAGVVPQYSSGFPSYFTIAKKGDVILSINPTETTTRGWIYTGAEWIELESYVHYVDLGTGEDFATLFAAKWGDLPEGATRVAYDNGQIKWWGHAYKRTDTYGVIKLCGYTSPYEIIYVLNNGTWSQVSE